MGMYDAQEASIRRQQMIAKALRDSGNQGFDPAASAGRLVYARSPWEDINKIAQLGVASYLDNRAEKRSGDLQDQRKADAKTRLAGMVDTLDGKSQNVLNQPNDPALSPLSGDVSVRNPVTGVNETVGIGNEMNQKRAGLAAILKGADPEEAVTMLQGKALEKALPSMEWKDVGGRLVQVGSDGSLGGAVEKSATPDSVLDADTSRYATNKGFEANVMRDKTDRLGQQISAATSRYTADRGFDASAADNETSVDIARMQAAVELRKAGIADATERWKKGIEVDKLNKPTEFAGRAVGHLNKMETAEGKIDKTYIPNLAEKAVGAIPNVGEALSSESYQSYLNESREWIAGLLRLDSGAAVPEEEFWRYFKTYFPQPNESAKQAEEKYYSRLGAAESLRGVLQMSGIDAPKPSVRRNVGGKTYIKTPQGWAEE